MKPYLQLGRLPKAGATDERVLMWKTVAPDPSLIVEVRSRGGEWQGGHAQWKWVRTTPVPRYGIGSATLAGLKLNTEYEYRLRRGEETLFTSAFRTRRLPGQPITFAVLGDCGSGRPGQKALAVELARHRPDFVLVPGDIVYDYGREREYRTNFFDIYNADAPNPKVGAPLLRNTLFVATVGNHDVNGRNFNRGGDGLAYYYNWTQPLNGLELALTSAFIPHILNASAVERRDFLQAAAPNYPRMGSFSFEDGDVHVTLLDSNPYVDWEDDKLREWLKNDLLRTNATWKIVLFHHPPFNASISHGGDQRMRVLAPLFEMAKVDLVIAGHEHNYQRTKPLRFTPESDPRTGRYRRRNNRVPGDFNLDREYDGQTRTRPKGVLYIVSGAGGQKLYKLMFRNHPFFEKGYRKTLSFSLVDVTPQRLTFRQIDLQGREVDRFVVDP